MLLGECDSTLYKMHDIIIKYLIQLKAKQDFSFTLHARYNSNKTPLDHHFETSYLQIIMHKYQLTLTCHCPLVSIITIKM